MPRSLFWLATFLIAVILFLATGCGSGSSSSTNPSPSPSPGLTPTPTPAVGGVNPPTVVTVAAGQSVSGTDITVSAPASNPPPNAQALGSTTGSQGTADNTGTIVMRGTTVTVLLFGPGLSGSMQISISGPADIAISQIRGIQSTTGVPGVAFQAVIAADAAQGARTVALQSSNGDITTFTGGLEIQ
jgi:hypothetical protein